MSSNQVDRHEKKKVVEHIGWSELKRKTALVAVGHYELRRLAGNVDQGELKRFVQVDWLLLRNLGEGVGQLVQKKVVVPFGLMELKRKVKFGQKQEVKSSAVKPSQVMVQEEECQPEYQFPAVEMTKTGSLKRKVEDHW